MPGQQVRRGAAQVFRARLDEVLVVGPQSTFYSAQRALAHANVRGELLHGQAAMPAPLSYEYPLPLPHAPSVSMKLANVRACTGNSCGTRYCLCGNTPLAPLDKARAGVERLSVEFLGDADELVVFRRAIGARQRSGLDLPAIGRPRGIGDRGIFRFTRAVGHDGGIAR